MYDPSVDVVAVRRAIGMVFQKPNPFPTMSIFDNVAAGPAPELAPRAATCAHKVEAALRGAGPVGARSPTASASPGAGLSGGQQQRLCIARSLAVDPEVILMDEPCSALDPIATLKIEELIDELKQRVTIVIVTHNMQQAARVADRTAFMLDGELVEVGPDGGDLHQTRPTPGPRNMSPASSASDEGRPRRTATRAASTRPGRDRRGARAGTRPLPGPAAASSRPTRSAAWTWSSSSSTACSRRSTTRTSSSPRW